MKLKLDPDQIGRIGEEQFAALCARAGLHCNRSAVDVMGWDFIVEFPMSSADQTLHLDQRLAKAAKIQLKSTVRRANGRVRLTLSAVDRLAKDPLPAVIIVFLLSDDGELKSGFLIHLLGKELARVLRRLRTAEAKEALNINHAEISYDYAKVGVRFEPSHLGLLQALSKVCGENPDNYMLLKQRQLAEIGYEHGQLEGEALIRVEGPEHFSSVLLGLEPLRPQSIRIFDNRFGIRLPYQGTLFSNIEELRLSPPALGHCEISVRGDSFGQAARFDGEIFVSPPLGNPHCAEVLIRTETFTIRLTQLSLKFESVGSINDIEHTLHDWAELLRALTLMSRGGATLTINREGSVPFITVPVGEALTGPYLEQVPRFSEFLDGWHKLLANAGLSSQAKIKFSAFWEANEARMAVDMMLNQKSQACFEFQEVETESTHLEGIYFNSTSFADTSITYSIKVLIERSEGAVWRYRSTRFEALDVRPKVVELEEYGLTQATERNIKLIIDPRYITLTPPEGTFEARK
ncbi:hypothetical protein [Comamonas thiooxydans]|uniref:hypothetical protein n=1 Tax=Comamonas thiooxydans TaxID=363952 RepID=UPI002115B630|nr:hypothetical protein [Comamonas thiooxydans]UUE95078.1 hypothetical protein MJ608_05355 [Comamonas thiooxydans]